MNSLYCCINFVFLLLLSFGMTAQAIFVKADATGSNDGSSWTNAYSSLQTALQNTSSGEIWVAAGIHKPTLGIERGSSFHLKNNVTLYGGFIGNETMLSQRNITANTTVLSGEIGDQSEITDNAYHVIIAEDVNSTAILDGFSISSGYADGSASNRNGGGIFLKGNNKNATPQLRNCTFTYNYGAGTGGGLSADLFHFSPTTQSILIENCTFSHNESGYGGAMSIIADVATSLEMDIKNCRFLDNNSTIGGGALYAYEGSSGTQNIRITNSVFANNQAIEGGAFEIFGGYNLTITNNTLIDNLASSGNHVLHISQGTNALFENCIIWGSPASNYLSPSLQISVQNSIVKGGFLNGSDIWTIPPKLENPSNGNFKLADCSPSINKGNMSALPSPTTDIEGEQRVYGGAIDLGAYEHQGTVLTNYDYAAAGESYPLTVSCANGRWTHYASPSDPGKYLFSIEHFPDAVGGNTNRFDALPILSVTSNPTNSTNFLDGIFKSEDIVAKEALFAMGRYWNVSLTDGNLNGFVNVRFYYEPSEFLAIEQAAYAWAAANGPGLLRATYWVKTEGIAYDPFLHLFPRNVLSSIELAGNPGTTSTGVNYVQFDEISSFSGGTAVVRVSDNNPILPVELLAFTAKRINETEVDLDWTMAQEHELLGYEIQRRLQSETEFRTIDFVDSKGNTSAVRDYRYMDQNDNKGWCYYRLKIVDLDGDFQYSAIRVVKDQDRLGNIDLYPNPAQQYVQVLLPTESPSQGKVQVSLLNTLQQVVFSQELSVNADRTVLVSGIDQFSTGVYLMTVEIEGRLFVEKLVLK